MDKKSLNHTDVLFSQFLQENGEDICPNQKDIIYIDGKIRCSMHSEDNEDGDDGSVPFL